MKIEDVRLALVFKDFAVWLRDQSCVGLNVAGYTTAKALRKLGVDVSVFPVRHNVDIVDAIEKYDAEHAKPLTHVVISAPWLSVYDLKSILYRWPSKKFVILSHSNVGFLQADPNAVELLRKYHELSQVFPNLMVGGNSKKFVDWMEASYGGSVIWLPNIYPLDHHHVKPTCELKEVIKIGAFGAVRPEKNFMTAAAAALAIHRYLGIPIELHMSSDGEGEKARTSAAIKEMCEGIEGVKLVRHHWAYWDHFIKIVGSMDLLLQLSYTESFNMVTADGISTGVPSVVSPAITWAPESWKADPDNALDAAKVGINLLMNQKEREKGKEALLHHNAKSEAAWLEWLTKGREWTSLFARLRSWFSC